VEDGAEGVTGQWATVSSMDTHALPPSRGGENLNPNYLSPRATLPHTQEQASVPPQPAASQGQNNKAKTIEAPSSFTYTPLPYVSIRRRPPPPPPPPRRRRWDAVPVPVQPDRGGQGQSQERTTIKPHEEASNHTKAHQRSPVHDSTASLNHRSQLPSGITNDLGRVGDFELLDAFDPHWRETFGLDLKEKGLTDDFIKDNEEYIVDFIREQTRDRQRRTKTLARARALPP